MKLLRLIFCLFFVSCALKDPERVRQSEELRKTLEEIRSMNNAPLNSEEKLRMIDLPVPRPKT